MFESVALFEKQSQDCGAIIDQFPKEFDLGADIEIIKTLSFPGKMKESLSTIHVFNTENYYCHSWAFYFNEKEYSIVIITSAFRPCLYTNFLDAVRKSFQEDNDSDQLCRYGFVCSLLQSWTLDDDSNLIANYPIQSFSINLNEVENWTQSFDVSPMSTFIEHVWKSIVSGSGILIIGDTAEIASNAVLASLSLIEPLRYLDPILIYTKRGDPRFDEILSGSTNYKIVGTTETELPFIKTQFELVARIPDQYFAPCPELQEQFQQKTVRLFSVIMGTMNHCLMTDPYYDILEKPITQITATSTSIPLTKSFFDELQRTNTFIKWRKRKIIRDQLRAAFLSVPPEEAIDGIDDNSLEKAKEELQRIYNSFEGDEHFRTVLKIHMKQVSKRIRSRDST